MFDISCNATFSDHRQVEALEKRYFPPDMVASAEETWAWAQTNSESLFLLRHQGRGDLLGHLSAFPINKETSNALMAGSIKDTDIAATSLLPYGQPDPFDIYFAVICVDTPYRPQGTFFLLSSFIRFLQNKIRQGNKINNIFAEAGTRDGQRMLKRRGFSPCDPSKDIPCYYHAPYAQVAACFHF